MPPEITAVVVHWRDEQHLARLVEAWTDDPRWQLLVVDNSRTLKTVAAPARKLDPGANLGFSGGVNYGVEAASAPWVLILNPDARPKEQALEHLLEVIQDTPRDVGGWVPALEDEDGRSQAPWQLQPLPGPWTLIFQTMFLGGSRGPSTPPSAGTVIEQPAAAALLLRRDLLQDLGGFDAGFYPAWFEDVDWARRVQQHGSTLRYAPAARFVHAMGGSVPQLGYGPFLWVYYRNLCRYLAKHHGTFWQVLARLTLCKGMALRILLLPLRRPRRAASRWQAAGALLEVILGALSGWRRPRRFVAKFRPRQAGNPLP